ncbi:hypothetical protein FHT82_002467 [Rhizobium sp. BK275]|uniref:ATP-binding protein n=1 Tax=Rhizobium sp. BK275 TaxID=2587077 RepID=UPI001622B584|nr:ATP-binding protein [Rhizobium sp. BK275]MBB3389727.1 hypothetical protein [Rhizobium sp. BK275]
MREFPKFHTKPFETDDERRRAASLPNATRQEMVTNLLVMDEQFDQVMDFIANRFHRPVDGGRHASGWIGGIIGESRTGKSWMAQYYASQHPHVLGDHGYSCPVIYVEAREDWDRIEFSKQIFLETGASAVPRLTLASMNTTVTRRLTQVHGQLLIVDDSQFLFETTPAKAATNRSLIHHVANQRQCNILLIGTEGVEFAIRSNDHLRNRGDFPAPIRLTSFDPKTPDGREAARTFLYEVEALLPFAVPSLLHRKEYVDDFLQASGGSRGRMMNFIVPAGCMAINEGSPCIQARHLRIACADRNPYGKDRVPFSQFEDGEN